MKNFKNPLVLAFALPFLYWLYLACTTSMYVVFDAIAYESLGSAIYHEGWVSFFKFKPYNVALYPFVISISMRIADLFSISYLPIQKCIQILFLIVTQILLYRILKKLDVRESIITAILLYFGFSPAIVNSAFSLFCEIITYPFVLGIILMSISAWKKILTQNHASTIFQGILLAILFVMISLVRQVYEYVLVFYLFTIFLLSLKFLFSKNAKALKNSLLLIITIFGIYHLTLLPYKAMNFKYNGYHSLTLVGSESLYSNTEGRTQKLDINILLAFLANVPGERVCTKFFSAEECSWALRVHTLGPKKTKELQEQGIPNDKIDSILKNSAIKNVLGNPLQYSFLTAAEGMKMIFWESTQIGYVKYPSWLEKIFGCTPIKNSLRLIIFLLTFISMILSCCHIFRHRKNIYTQNPQKTTTTLTHVFCLTIIMGNIILHAPFNIATRYALPIAPLYLVLIALNIQHFFENKISWRVKSATFNLSIVGLF